MEDKLQQETCHISSATHWCFSCVHGTCIFVWLQGMYNIPEEWSVPLICPLMISFFNMPTRPSHLAQKSDVGQIKTWLNCKEFFKLIGSTCKTLCKGVPQDLTYQLIFWSCGVLCFGLHETQQSAESFAGCAFICLYMQAKRGQLMSLWCQVLGGCPNSSLTFGPWQWRARSSFPPQFKYNI